MTNQKRFTFLLILHPDSKVWHLKLKNSTKCKNIKMLFNFKFQVQGNLNQAEVYGFFLKRKPVNGKCLFFYIIALHLFPYTGA